MAQTVIDASARVTQWDDRFFMEYVRANRFNRYMGTDENAVIQVNERLGARKGDEIRCTLVGALRGSRNNGTTSLVGNEKSLQNYAWGTKVRTVRDATTVDMDEEQASPIDIRNACRMALRDLSLQYLRDDIIGSLADRTGSPNVGNSEAGTMTDDQWDAANADRAVYGLTKSTGGGFQSQIDTISTEKMDVATVDLAATLAKTSGLGVGGTNDKDAPNKIRPIKTAEDEEWYVMFVSTTGYNNLKADTVIQQANREAWQRYGGSARTGGSGTNPLYRSGDLVYGGVIIREISELDDLPAITIGVGPATADQAFLCGAQAVHAAWAQRTRTTLKKEDDYGYQYGVGFSELRGVSKNWWARAAGSTALRQWGVVSVFTGK